MIEYSRTTFAIVPVVVHVILSTEPALKFSPPFGDVRVIVEAFAPMIVKSVLLISFVVPFEASETRTRPDAVGAFGTVHAKLPLLGILEMMVEYVTPELIEYSSTTLAIVPVEVQPIFWTDPAAQFSPPFGDVRVSVGAGSATMVKRVLLTSFVEFCEASEIRTRADAVGVLGTTQA